MKKIYLIAAMLIAAATSINAQNEQTDTRTQFIHEDGSVVENGSVVNLSTVSEDIIMGGNIAAGLSLQNTSNDRLAMAVSGQVSKLDNGSIQFCFPTDCYYYNSTRSYSQTGFVSGKDTRNLRLEWFFDAENVKEGDAAAMTLQVEIRNTKRAITGQTAVGDDIIAYGPAITVNFTYPDPSRVSAIENDNPTVVARYNAMGARMDKASRGLNIIKLSNGKTIKQVIK